MKERNFTGIALIFVTAIIVLAGCSRNSAPSGAAVVQINPSGVYPAASGDGVSLSVLIQQPFQVSDMVNNSFTKSLEDKLNIKLNLVVAPSDGYGDRLRLLISTGDYPEVIAGGAGDVNEVYKYGAEEKIYIPLESYFDTYAKHVAWDLTNEPGYRDGITSKDGHIYSVSNVAFTMHTAARVKMWINTAWIDKLGLKMPTTVEEFKNVLIAFRDRDPNGNGIKDEIPLSGDKNPEAEPWKFILNSFGYYVDSTGPLLKLQNSQITTIADQDYLREGLRFARDLYREGLMDQASLTQEQAQLAQLMATNPPIVGAYTSSHMARGVDVSVTAIAKQYDVLLPLIGTNGYRGTPTYMTPTYSGGTFAITDKCKNPEAAIRFLDELMDPEVATNGRWGPKGVVWDSPDPGALDCTGNPATYKALPAMDVTGALAPRNDYWSSGALLDAYHNLNVQFDGDLRAPEAYESYLWVASQGYFEINSPYDQLKSMTLTSDETAELNNMATPIRDYVRSAIVEFIAGIRNIDTGWDAYLSDLDKLRYKDYVRRYAELYFAQHK
jgi:putative aldouronate transport system substrate-binding protein